MDRPRGLRPRRGHFLVSGADSQCGLGYPASRHAGRGMVAKRQEDRHLDKVASRPNVLAGSAMKVSDLGHDEIWLQNWLASSPSRLGLGDVKVLAQELHQGKAGSLDILAADGDRYFSIEVQLGEVDASHGFRVLDYWARNRQRYPGQTHVAVLIAESTGGRYRQALEALVEFLPLIVIELQVWRGELEAVVVPRIVLAGKDLDVSTLPAGNESERTDADWRAQLTDEAWHFHERFVEWTQRHGEIRVDYTPRSYIGVRRGRRVWAPLWPRTDGAGIYLPDPDGSREDEPSAAYERFAASLKREGIDLSWTGKYNAGANPIGPRLRTPDLDKPAVEEFLRATFEILEPGKRPWSERHPLNEVASSSEPVVRGDE